MSLRSFCFYFFCVYVRLIYSLKPEGVSFHKNTSECGIETEGKREPARR